MTQERDWLTPVFNVIVLAIFLSLLAPVMAAGRLNPFPADINEAAAGLIGSYNFRLAGRFAIRFLTLSLAISPLVYFLGWRRLIPLRKWSGLWAFAFAALHCGLFFSDIMWPKVWGNAFVYAGLAALLILLSLALTSHRPAMRLLGADWKRLHRLVYVAGALVSLHSINGLLYWRDVPNFDIALLETQITGAQIGLLLIMRVPALRRRLPRRRRKRGPRPALS